MRRNLVGNLWKAGASTLLVFAIAACVDEKIVYRDGPIFTQPPSAAGNFLGYSDENTKKTVCGNCHAGQQGKWAETAHSDAFATLEGSGHMSASCQGCHTVSAKGNAAASDNVGWTSTSDDRYKDVQCESCHGAGLEHVTGAARGQMLASMHADTGATVTNGCAECHSGTHHPFVEEWRRTRHATSYTRSYNGATATAPDVPYGPRSACQSCHIGQKVLEAWGVNTNYLEKSLGTTIATGEGVTCVVCHDPHGSGNSKQLRYSITSTDPESNLCVRCHNRRGNPDFAGSRDTPHAPHGPLLFGTAGWWPPGVDFSESQSTHGSERNPKLCAGCHMSNYAVNDPSSGSFQVQVVGHRWLPIPCVDASGNPTASQTCDDSQRSFKTCAAAGCHSQASARTAYHTAEADLLGLAAAVDNMLTLVPASQKLPAAAGKITVARGAAYNSNLGKAHGTAAHNPFLVKNLLRASIVALANEYNLPKPPGFNLAPYDQMLQKSR